MSQLGSLLAAARRGSKKHPSLVSAIEKFYFKRVFDDVSEKQIQIDEANILRAILRKRKEMFERRKAEYRLAAVHPSQISGCRKEAVFRMLQAPKGMHLGAPDAVAKLQRIFDNGDYLHLRMQCLMIMMGLCTVNDVEVEFHTKNFAGTCDGVLNFHGRAILEIKSINERGFIMAKKSGRPADLKHVEQSQMYMWAHKADRTYILYENKNNQDLFECIVERDSALINSLLSRGKGIMADVKAKRLPARPFNNPSAPPCSYCHFTELCFNRAKEAKWLKTL